MKKIFTSLFLLFCVVTSAQKISSSKKATVSNNVETNMEQDDKIVKDLSVEKVSMAKYTQAQNQDDSEIGPPVGLLILSSEASPQRAKMKKSQ